MEYTNNISLFNNKNSRNNKKIINTRFILFISVNIIISIYIINSYFINIPNTTISLRNLAEDPRTKGANEICMLIQDNDLYDLKELEVNKYPIGENIFLKFCKNIDEYDSSCIYKKDTEVIKLSGDIKGEEGNKNKIELISNDILKIYLASGEKYNETAKYQVNIELKCNQSLNDFTLDEGQNFDIKNNRNNILTIKGQCKQACVLKDHYGKNLSLAIKIIIGIAFLVVGIYMGIFGYRGRSIGVFLICISGLVFLSDIILKLFDVTDLVIKIVVMVVFGLCGIGLSIFFVLKQKFLKIYMVLLGGITGYLISTIINDLFISIIDTEYLKLIKGIVIVVSVVIGILFSIFFTKGTFIIGTSILGSYCLMRAFSFFLDDVLPFIDEIKIYELAKHQNYEKIAEMVWGLFLIYPAMLIVFIVVTIIVQFKLNPKWRDVEDYKLLEKNYGKEINLPEFRIKDEDDK